MKRLFFISSCFCFLLFPYFAKTQSSNVTFKASIKSTSENPIPTVYVKIYSPEEDHAVDSMLSDALGNINQPISFTYQTGLGINNFDYLNKIVVRKISPNIITQRRKNYSLEYNYPGKAQIYFIDMQGKRYPNYSELSTGIYFYYLLFNNGVKSEYNKIIVSEVRTINIELINIHYSLWSKQKSATEKILDEENFFYAELIKDGYVTKRDTILIDSVVIERNYTLTDADKPMAAFSTSGIKQVGEVVMFDASASTSASGETLVYSWDFGDNKKGQSVGIPHLYNIPGDYTVKLTVTGNYGAKHSSSQTITIDPGPTAESNSGSLIGFINDEALFALPGATVSLVEGSAQGTTDTNGQIELTNLPVGIPIHLTVSKNGYVNQIVEITIPNETEEALFYSTLKVKGTISSLINAEFGGIIEGTEGTKVELPVEGLIKQDGSFATGEVNVSITPVNVVEETHSFPGTFKAYREDGEDGVLLSYGVSDFTFEQGTEKLQLADGKTATIIVPIYTSGAEPGDEIDLWSVNETNGSWVQEGSGVVVMSDYSPTGLALEATVGHFSWWNCDDFNDDTQKKGRCYKWICDKWNYCTKAEVPCWVDGKRNPGVDQKSTLVPKRLLVAEDVPPVFEVRDYLPADGKYLFFPVNRDTYIRATHRDEEGDYYRGEYTVLGSSDVDTFEIELTKLDLEDSLNLPLNTIIENYLYKKTTYTVDIPTPKLYYMYYKSGQYPSLNGNYVISDSAGILSSGIINWYNDFVYASYNNLFITIDGKTLSDEGYFQLGMFEPEVTSIMLDDSVGATLTNENHLKFYGLRSDKNTVATIKYYEQESADGGCLFRFISPVGEELQREGIYTTPKSFTTPIRKDSTYLLEFSATTETNYGIILTTKEEEVFEIVYGDTVDAALSTIGEVDMYHFTGQQNDLISILVSHPYGLNQAKYELWDEEGNTLGQRELFYGTSYLDRQEIVFKLPEDGDFNIVVFCEGNYTGDYQVILNKLEYEILSYNACNVYEPAGTEVKYFEVEIPEDKNTCFSFLSFETTGYGTFDIHNQNCERINDNYHRSFMDAMYYSYVGSEPQGKYFVKITDNNASKICINIFEATQLAYNNKGLAQVQNSFDIEGEVNVYQTNIKPGDGIHAIMETIDGQTSPESSDIYFYPVNGGGDPVNLSEKKIHYNTLDSTILIESCGKVTEDDTTWIVMTTGPKTGHYQLSFHQVEQSEHIIVDDDFAEYPEANTSSIVAAGYAIEENGSILVANGEYFSYSPIAVESDSVELYGQDKDNIMISSVWNYNHSSCITLDFRSQGGHVHNLTFSNGDRAYNSISVSANDVTLEDIDIKKYDENIELDGEVKLGGNNLVVRNINIDGSSYGIQIGGINGLVESCTLLCESQGIKATGSHLTIKNNTIHLTKGNRAIYNTCGQGQGNNIIDSNNIVVDYEYFGSEGIITAQENGRTTDDFTSYVRGNTIITSSGYYGMMLTCGNPPSRLIAENNKYISSYVTGGKAFWLYPGRSDGGSTILVWNNTFDGLSSENSINISYPEYLSEGQEYGVYNNSFRFAAGAESDATNGFIGTYSDTWAPFTDTASYYIINNIFEGNGISHFIKCNSDLSFYSDYNVVYNFGGYVYGENGTLIGTSNDQTTDPVFLDDDLHIGAGSSAINHGASPTLFPNIPTTDKEGVLRPLGGAYDIGAFERE